MDEPGRVGVIRELEEQVKARVSGDEVHTTILLVRQEECKATDPHDLAVVAHAGNEYWGHSPVREAAMQIMQDRLVGCAPLQMMPDDEKVIALFLTRCKAVQLLDVFLAEFSHTVAPGRSHAVLVALGEWPPQASGPMREFARRVLPKVVSWTPR